MPSPKEMMRSFSFLDCLLTSSLIFAWGCSDPGESEATGSSSGGAVTSGGAASGGGSSGGGSSDGGTASGGAAGGGAAGGGGTTTTGGTVGGGGLSGVGGVGTSDGGTSSGGAGVGGFMPSGGGPSGGGPSGGSSSGGASGGNGAGGSAAGGSGTGGSGTTIPELDCSTAVNAPMPDGGTLRMNNGSDGDGNLAWEIWSNTGTGQLTTYPEPAFIASWNNDGGYLGRLGFEWNRWDDPDPVPYEEHGTLIAQFAARKTEGTTAGDYSYIGMYGWSVNPCVEWYIIEDIVEHPFNTMPFDPGNTTLEGVEVIDGEEYNIYSRPTPGTGGSRCDSSITNWIQYYSVRNSARLCGTISLTEHFDKWKALGLDMGGLLEAKILVEVGGGTGSVELPVANVMELD